MFKDIHYNCWDNISYLNCKINSLCLLSYIIILLTDIFDIDTTTIVTTTTITTTTTTNNNNNTPKFAPY